MMYKLGLVLGWNIISIYYINLVESKYKFGLSPLNNEFISKDLSDLGLNVYLEEFDFIPREVSTKGRNKEVCKNSLKTNYENDVYGLCEHFECDIAAIATRPYDKRILPLTPLPDNTILPKTENVTDEQRRKCNLAKLAARCSSYLRFSNCIYTNYIEAFRIASSFITLDKKALEIFGKYPNNELVDGYNSVGGGTISFIFREFLQNICSFVHNSCPDLHPQFKKDKEYFMSQSCIVFDTITTFSGYDELFNRSVGNKLQQSLVSKEKEAFSLYYTIETDLVQSQLNIPLEYPYNLAPKLKWYKNSLSKHRCDLINNLYMNTNQLDLYEDQGKYRIYSICYQLEKHSEYIQKLSNITMKRSECESYIKGNDLVGLVNWLNEEEANVVDFGKFISTNIRTSAEFVCEHVYFVYTGKVKRSLNVFKDDDMNVVAASLGSSSVYSDGRMSDLKDEYTEVSGYRRPENFMNTYRQCCEKVEENVAFSSIMQIIKCSGDDYGELIKILGKVINRVERGRSSLITNSLVSILGYIEKYKRIQLNPTVAFLESMWNKKDEDDTHGVGGSSLKDFSTNVIMKIKSSKVMVVETNISVNESCLMLGNLVCKNQQNIYNWVCGLSLKQSAPVAGALDSFSINDAVCLYLLLESEQSLIPRVYSSKTLGLMLFKLSHVFLSNLRDDRRRRWLCRMAIESGEMGIKYMEAASLLNNTKVIDDIHMFPWHLVGYLSILLNEVDCILDGYESGNHNEMELDEDSGVVDMYNSNEVIKIDKNRVTHMFKRVLELSTPNVMMHILKGMIKSVGNEFGRSLCLMECKNISINWNNRDVDDEEGVRTHIEFFKYIMDYYTELSIITTLEDSLYDSLSILLNWIKYLLLSKNRNKFKEIIRCNYLEFLRSLYNKLNEEAMNIQRHSHTSNIYSVFLNKLDLIKFVVDELFVLIKEEG